MTSTPQSTTGQEVKQAKNAKEKGLFDQDDDDDEEDLFATKSVVAAKQSKGSVTKKSCLCEFCQSLG